MIKYENIYYVGSSKPLICRDGNKQYADSMDLKFRTYDWLDLPDFDRFNDPNYLYNELKEVDEYCVIIDISVGWTSLYDISIIEDFIKYYNEPKKCKVYFRLVDQFPHQELEEVYTVMKALSNIYNVKIIGTYEVDYYGLDKVATIPYPYLVSEELERLPGAGSSSITLTGANVKNIYPIREKLINNICGKSKYLSYQNHPGYSGKGWDKGLIGKDYLMKLAESKCMICTTTYNKYELLKYIECAEIGCVCIGEVPISYVGTDVEKWIVRIPEEVLDDSNKFDNWYETKVLTLDINTYSMNYRNSVKELNDKESLKSLLLSAVNS